MEQNPIATDKDLLDAEYADTLRNKPMLVFIQQKSHFFLNRDGKPQCFEVHGDLNSPPINLKAVKTPKGKNVDIKIFTVDSCRI